MCRKYKIWVIVDTLLWVKEDELEDNWRWDSSSFARSGLTDGELALLLR